MTFTTTHAHTSDPATSHDAATAAQHMAERHKAVICGVLLFAQGWGGLTSQEISSRCELDYLQVVRRISDLKRDERVVDSGERRASPGGRRACVWMLA